MPIPLEEGEIVVGLVLHLDPEALEEEGAVAHRFGRHRSGPYKRRYYLCTAVDGEQSAWAPMYGHKSRNRLLIQNEFKRGPDYFTQGTHHVDPGTVYVCDHVQLVVGLRAGRDRAKPWERPHVVVEGIPGVVLNSGQRVLAGEELPRFDAVAEELLAAANAPTDEVPLSPPTPCVIEAPEPPSAPVEPEPELPGTPGAWLQFEALKAARFSLEKIGCQFYRCPGPTSLGPEDEMCHVCRTLKTVSSALDG